MGGRPVVVGVHGLSLNDSSFRVGGLRSPDDAPRSSYSPHLTRSPGKTGDLEKSCLKGLTDRFAGLRVLSIETDRANGAGSQITK